MTGNNWKSRGLLVLLTVAALAAVGWYAYLRLAPPPPWTESERAVLRSLWIDKLPPLPPDPTNAVADSRDAAMLGHRLFFEPALSANGMISCATCHQPLRRFTDGLPRAVALGMSARNTPSIVAAAYSPWFYWDGRKDSQWSQSLSPIEDPNEHGSSRMQVLSVIASNSDYRLRYEAVFGQPPVLNSPDDIDRAFSNIGKAIAAYERKLLPGRSSFDKYVSHMEDGGDHIDQEFLSIDEIRGLRLFIGDARCTECHNGPLLTNNEFHNTGLLSIPGEVPDRGRIDGVRIVKNDPFNCLGRFSDDKEQACSELRYMRTGSELIGATRTPSLRNLGNTAPFQSKGQFATLAEVLKHYNEAPPAMIGHNEAKALNLAAWQLRQLEDFLLTLDAPVAADPSWLAPPSR